MKRLATGLIACAVASVGACGAHAGLDLKFERRIAVDAPAEATWEVLRLSFLDSSDSPVWPRELETIRASELAAGAAVDATYHLPAIGDVPQTYTLAAYDERQRSLRYETSPSHPLAGGATVSVERVDGGSLVHWKGEYDISLSPRSQASALFTRYFVGVFFDELDRGLARWADARPSAGQ